MAELFNNKYRIDTTRLDWAIYGNGSYFITACTKDGIHHFGEITNDKMKLNQMGMIMKENIENLSLHYPYASIPYYVVMPNHIHLYLIINHENNESVNNGKVSLVAKAVGGLKSAVKRYAINNGIYFFWQPRFYEHIIRDYKDSEQIINYILTNESKWIDDKYHR